MKFKFVLIFVSVVGLIGTLSLIKKSRSNLCGYACFKRTQPAPYQNNDYFSENFLKASLNFPQTQFTSQNIPFYTEYSSQWLNVFDGHRKTSNSPCQADKKIFIVGGSAVVGQEVPDEWTLASQLQLLVEKGTAVENYGFSGITSNQQLKVLNTLNIKPNDIVIFYDGVNDNLSVFLKVNNSHKDSDLDYENAFIDSLSILKKMVLKNINPLRHYLLNFSYFASFLGDEPTFIFQNIIPDYLKSTDQVKILSQNLKKELGTNIELARKSVESRGGRFIHIFQPYLNPDYQFSSYERLLYSNLSLYPDILKLSLKEGYSIYSEMENMNKDPYLSFKKLSAKLSEHRNNRDYFLDFCHLNHEGNRIIAEEIFNFLDKNNYLGKHILK